MIVYDVIQGSEEWFRLRLGKPTASEFHKIITAKGRKLSAQADGYIEHLVGEQMAIYYPERVESYTNRSIRWGQECEAEARRWYVKETNHNVQKVGFITDDQGVIGCSPDGIVFGDDEYMRLAKPRYSAMCAPDGIVFSEEEYTPGFRKVFVGGQSKVVADQLPLVPIGGIELKCPKSATHVGYLVKNEMPADYLAQVHGALIVTGLPWWDFVSYCPGLPGFRVRVTPNEFTEDLRTLLVSFCQRYSEVLAQVKSL